MKILDLFSGIGGFSLAADWMRWETVAFCERDEFCQKVLKKHWPATPIFDDIKTLNGDEFNGAIDIICGGFPCQPWSNAGERRGKADDRHLWPEMLRVVQQVRPRWVVGENVAGIVNMGLDQVLFDLGAEGYSVQSFNIPALAVGARHLRERIWIIAHADSDRPQSFREREIHALSQTQKCAFEGIFRPGIWTRLHSSGIRRSIDGIPVWLDTGASFLNRSHRVKALGNSVIPQIVYLIFLEIARIEQLMGSLVNA